MLYRFDPFHEMDRLSGHVTEGRRGQALPMDAYRTGEEVRVDFDMHDRVTFCSATPVHLKKQTVVDTFRRWLGL